MSQADESGYTLIELLVGMVLFAAISIGFYQVMISGVRGSETTRSVAEISEEARAGLNRITRDLREADSLDAASASSFTIWIDYDGDETRDYTSYEYVRYTFTQASGTISVEALDATGTVLTSGVLMDNVTKDGTDTDLFSYSSNRLEYDWIDAAGNPTPDGVTTWQEVDDPPAGYSVGDRDGTLDATELAYISNVSINFDVAVGGEESEFAAEAQLRNRRFSV
jgi:prepilin-type N-terminal cleavage/methylation domain-containing protein